MRATNYLALWNRRSGKRLSTTSITAHNLALADAYHLRDEVILNCLKQIKAVTFEKRCLLHG
ncbi:hypothetical protein B6V76_02925 [Thioclava sp. IC9]|nr:hypothetical protein B6V76_02925 [Thioclava sp. IC9]